MANATATEADRLIEQSKAMVSQTQAQGTTAFKGSSYDTAPTTQGQTKPDNSVITSDNLAPATPMTVPQGTTQTNTPALLGTIEGQAKTYAETVVPADKLAAEEKAKTESYQALVDKITGTKGETGLTDEAYSEKGGVDDKKALYNKSNNDITAEQTALRRRVEAIEKNPRGATAQGVAQEVRAAEKESLAIQADLAVIAAYARDDYFGAKEIAARKVAAQLEDDAQQIKLLGLAYEENKEMFTKSEQRQFESQQTERLRLLEKEGTELKAVNDLALNALQNGAPVDVVRQMQRAKTQEEALSYGGSYIGKLARDTELLQQQKLRGEIQATTDRENAITQVNDLALSGDSESSKSALAALLSGDLISDGTKGRIAPTISVLNAVDEFANMNLEGSFTGIGVAGRTKEWVKGLFNKRSPEATTNAQNIDAINLKVQQWASGASLTEQQTEQVNKLTPTKNDSDKVVREKMSGLYNYMLNQAESDLLSDGVNVQFQPVNLFEIADLYKQASPEQRKLIEETYFNK